MATCEQMGCGSCCIKNDQGQFCEVASVCKNDPIWQAIVIPSVIFLLAVILIIIAIVKLRNYKQQTMKVRNFAHQEIRIEPKFSNARLPTLTSIV